MRVFISYRREDSAGHAGRLRDDLEDALGSVSSRPRHVGVLQGRPAMNAGDRVRLLATAMVEEGTPLDLVGGSRNSVRLTLAA